MSKEERDARLDALAEATKTWAVKKKADLTAQVTLCKKILKGRTGSDRLANASVTSVSSLVVDQINDFLTG
jgi:hypothetical protein